MSGELYPDVTHHFARLNGIQQHWVTAGTGPPVYLLHGFPETWFGWRKQIPELARRHTVVAPDLRGYGATEKPVGGYDKRTMANDVIALMNHLGHDRIALVGHDRGARVGTRFAKDHPGRLDRLAVIDNIPTRVVAETFDIAKARAGYWYFPFLGILDLPEALIAGKEDVFLSYFYRTWSYNPEMLSQDEIDVYVRAYRQPGAIRGACADYRAAGEDITQDTADADVPIEQPVLALWGADFEGVGKAYDVAAVWRDLAPDLRAVALPQCGHLCQEERPDLVNEELRSFLTGWLG
ncbi:alpha/beta hydrolase [Amycolatopsis sp. NPDC005232]|uniref:alpha/beta fold hydrolase n=1 Tax=Amycolatopsis sp. NPDC005232 TaxID=3157027 RepID=UPI0033B52C21